MSKPKFHIGDDVIVGTAEEAENFFAKKFDNFVVGKITNITGIGSGIKPFQYIIGDNKEGWYEDTIVTIKNRTAYNAILNKVIDNVTVKINAIKTKIDSLTAKKLANSAILARAKATKLPLTGGLKGKRTLKKRKTRSNK
jgi:hypothetical protein